MLLEFRDGRSIQLSMRVLAGSAAFGIGRNASGDNDEDYLQITSLDAIKYVSGSHCNLRVGPGLGFWVLISVWSFVEGIGVSVLNVFVCWMCVCVCVCVCVC